MRDDKGRFIKGHPLGRRYQKGEHQSPATEFRKGMTPWNKGQSGKTGQDHPLFKSVERTCHQCRTTFYRAPSVVRRGGGRYCSRICTVLGNKRFGPNHPRWIKDRSKLKHLGDENLDRRSSAYNTWRREVWLRDNFKCKIANPDCKGRIEAHHILAWRDYPELRYQITNGITLCHFHHPKVRKEEKRLAPLFTALVAVSKDTI